MSRMVRTWREAATLMLCSPRSTNDSRSNHDRSTRSAEKMRDPHAVPSEKEAQGFNILMLKRSSQSQFLPSVYVFPGGISHDSDFSQKWLDLFQSCGERLNFDNFVSPNKSRLTGRLNVNYYESVFSKKRDMASSLPGEIGIRISAIRETFEESGVLIAKPIDEVRLMKNGSNSSTSLAYQPVLGSTFTSAAVWSWRERVIQDAGQFLVMCAHLDLVPDVWALTQWSNWLTPVISAAHLTRHARRFDTAFFACCVPNSAHAVEDQGETVHSLWSSPKRIVQSWYQNEVGLASPQLYELSRLLNFEDTCALVNFLRETSCHRPDRWMGVFCVCKDVLLELLPGDSLYPEYVNYNNDAVIFREESHDELKTKFPKRHRLVYSKTPKRGRLLGVESNVQLPSHVIPVNIIRHQSDPSVQ